MVRTWSVGASIGGAVLAAVLLAGCGAGSDDVAASSSGAVSADPSAGAPTTTVPSPGATPADYVPASLEGPAQNVPEPVMPELAKEESRDGAQAFLDYWSDAMWYAYQTGDTSYARDVIASQCETCMKQLKLIDDVYAGGAWFIGGRETPKLQNNEIVRSVEGVYKPVVLSGAEGVKLVENGKVTYEAFPMSGQGDPFTVYLHHVDGAWLYITAANMSGSR